MKMKPVKRAYVKNMEGNYNYNFPIEDKRYKEGDIIIDVDNTRYKVIFDDPVCTRVEEIHEGKYEVIMKSYDEEDYREVITSKPVDFRQAIQIQRGVEINMNHNDYYTLVQKVHSGKEDEK